MTFTISDIKTHAEEFFGKLGVGAEHEWAKAVGAFSQFLEGKQAVADAVKQALLQSKGYSVTPPAPAQLVPADGG